MQSQPPASIGMRETQAEVNKSVDALIDKMLHDRNAPMPSAAVLAQAFQDVKDQLFAELRRENNS